MIRSVLTLGLAATLLVTAPASGQQADALEPNDTPDTAVRLGPGDQADLTLREPDWYRVHVEAGGRLDVEIRFDHAQGDLDLAVGTADLQLVERSQGATHRERVRVSNLAAGDYVILVYGYQGATNDYALRLRGDLATPDQGGGGLINVINAQPLRVEFSASAYATPPNTSTQVDFSAAASGGKAPFTYDWDFDGGFGPADSGRRVSHTFPGHRPYDVVLTVTDADGQTASTTRRIGVLEQVPDMSDRRLRNTLTPSSCSDPSQPTGGGKLETVWVTKRDDLLLISDGSHTIGARFEGWEGERMIYRTVTSGPGVDFPARGRVRIWLEGDRVRLDASLAHLSSSGSCLSAWIFDARE